MVVGRSCAAQLSSPKQGSCFRVLAPRWWHIRTSAALYGIPVLCSLCLFLPLPFLFARPLRFYPSQDIMLWFRDAVGFSSSSLPRFVGPRADAMSALDDTISLSSDWFSAMVISTGTASCSWFSDWIEHRPVPFWVDACDRGGAGTCTVARYAGPKTTRY